MVHLTWIHPGWYGPLLFAGLAPYLLARTVILWMQLGRDWLWLQRMPPGVWLALLICGIIPYFLARSALLHHAIVYAPLCEAHDLRVRLAPFARRAALGSFVLSLAFCCSMTSRDAFLGGLLAAGAMRLASGALRRVFRQVWMDPDLLWVSGVHPDVLAGLPPLA